MLARAPRATAEVALRLERRGFSAAIVEETMAGLRARGYVDDDAFARRRAEELILRRGCGPWKVRHELTGRGLADSVVERAIAAVLEDRQPTDLARSALHRRFRGRPPVTAADRARAYRFLIGRGHDADAVSAVLEEEI